ncbi:YybH family protein [Novosphingobium lindaniclasticum]
MSELSIEDRIQIRELYGIYALAAAVQDTDGWLACWTRDAIWKTPQFEICGQVALAGAWAQTWSNFGTVSAFYELGRLTHENGTVSVLASVFEAITLKSGDPLQMTGLYRDTIRVEDGEWRFARREYELVGDNPFAKSELA